MDTSFQVAATIRETPSRRCIRCCRPAELCFCASIPDIDNRTDVLIVQHRRERFHAFNSARIVHQSLNRCRLLADHTPRLAGRFASTPLSDRAALLYPGDDASLLTELHPDQYPDQLIVLDGTWNHAKTLMRDLPRIQSLPRYRLAPSSPSRYRIRREPSEQSLSTLEATVAALRVLEPTTAGLDRLLAAFSRMIDDQIERSQSSWRRNRRRRRGATNVPRSFSGDLSNIVVAYGEQERGGQANDHKEDSNRLPIYWVAERLGSGETFRCAIETRSTQDDEFLACLRLGREDFRDAVSIETFRQRWKAFVRPSDMVAMYHQSTAKLLREIDAEFAPSSLLKSVKIDRNCRGGTLDDVVRALGIETNVVGQSRADRRLANAIALVRYFHTLCEQAV